jgi:hypothetical protein
LRFGSHLYSRLKPKTKDLLPKTKPVYPSPERPTTSGTEHVLRQSQNVVLIIVIIIVGRRGFRCGSRLGFGRRQLKAQGDAGWPAFVDNLLKRQATRRFAGFFVVNSR